MARLAVQRDLQHQGLGGELLTDALARAAAFYEHHGFKRVAGNPHRLVQKMSDIAAAIGRRSAAEGVP